MNCLNPRDWSEITSVCRLLAPNKEFRPKYNHQVSVRVRGCVEGGAGIG